MQYNRFSCVFLLLFPFLYAYAGNQQKESGKSSSSLNTCQNINYEMLGRLTAAIDSGKYGIVHSVLIMKDDSLIYENYWRGYKRDDLHQLHSATKSFQSAIIGIALEKKWIHSVDDPIIHHFPHHKGIWKNWPFDKKSITIKHLLTMTSGFEWDESKPYNDSSGNSLFRFNERTYHKLSLFDTLDIVDPPGTRHVYNSGGVHLLSYITTYATHHSAEYIAKKYLFRPLDIKKWYWSKYCRNVTSTSGELWLRPVDMVTFGQLYLHNGLWHGKQVLSPQWIKESTAKFITATPDLCDKFDYGYLWWRYSERHQEMHELVGDKDVYFAAGAGGQFIWVIPFLNMVVVSTADQPNKLNRYGNEVGAYLSEPMLWEYIIPACTM